jgi:hypothetical protein
MHHIESLKVEDYLHILKAFVEGDMDLADWRDWWNKNASAIEPRVSRIGFLRLKHQPFRQAQNLLEEFGVGYQADKSKCQTCGETLFVAVPGETTKEDIIKFARRATLPGAEQIEQEGWIHAGEYCPNGCTFTLTNYGSRDLWERLEKDFEKTHSCSVTVTGNATLPHPLSSYNVYIDGNVARPRRKDIWPNHEEFVRLLPGDHRIVVRERDVKKVNRLESNTLWFTASEGVLLRFEVGMSNGYLTLIQSQPEQQ